MLEPLAIIGSGCRLPGGAETPSKLWSVLKEPQDLSRKPAADRFNIDAFYHPVGTHNGTTNATKSYWLEGTDRSDVTRFDAGFFNIQPAEADAMDPQQRLLMETVYDCLCAAGQPMEKLRGSNTAVYVGSMCDDYNTMITRDWETLPRYTATGLERGILANRVSYFFDWRGPSVSVDTACSSSLVALDYAVQTIRSGRADVAVAAGTSLILSPAMYISESNLGMLSPNGRCAMWDVQADGYARGEGVAVVMIKPLSQALRDNDPIECVIRDTAVNQDGRSAGLTVPSNVAQTTLIRECYARAGLDPVNNPKDRPQFFQAHGTGTQAGDPQEAEAITNALFPSDSFAAQGSDKLLVGSIKTVIGHTEGTAGLASVIAATQALRNATVPPNLHFKNLSSKVAPFFSRLEIPVKATPWPVTDGAVKRASVNSFGFGGTNAHCILESYECDDGASLTETPLSTPLVFSAHSEKALRTLLADSADYLAELTTPSKFRDFAYTLQHRRTTFNYRHALTATTLESALTKLQSILQPVKDDPNTPDLSIRYSNPSQPRVLGVFTGQGAQWPRMGAELIETTAFAASRIDDLDQALQSLSEASDRPSWTLKDQLLASKDTSRLGEAALSQPLCTAVQVILVDILETAGIKFKAVVGHSSGEIGAAYAAGLVSATDAIRIAYFRGVHAKLASSPSTHSPPGAMMAVGSSVEEAWALCRSQQFDGRIRVAAVNSSSSVTLSGDEDAINEAEKDLKEKGVFARKLKVDTAYHSAHMDTCAAAYLDSLRKYVSEIALPANDVAWFSSVFAGRHMRAESLNHQYWVDNMCNTVLFADALSQAVQQEGDFDLAVELGPHPALKGPAAATLDSVASVPYTGVLSRGESDIASLSSGLGFIWTRLGYGSVNFTAVEGLLSSQPTPRALSDLPLYPFDHQRSYWISSRIPNHFKHRSPLHVSNPVLGNPCSEATTPGEFQWRKILQPSELPWLKGHMLQGQTVFPATGYVSMAVEAIKAVVLDSNADAEISLIKLLDVGIGRAIAFNDDSTSIETIFSVSSVVVSETAASMEWACYSVSEGAGNAILNAKGVVIATISPASPESLPLTKTKAFNLVNIDEGHFYDNLSKIGYDYASPFRGLSNIRRKLGYSTGTLSDQSGSGWDDDLTLHPGMLDSALQTVFAAWSFPGDTSIWSLHVPVTFSAITINPYFTPLEGGGKQQELQFESFLRSQTPGRVVSDIYVQVKGGSHAFINFEGAALVPFTPATTKDHLPMFSRFEYKIASPDGEVAGEGEKLSEEEVQLYEDVDRVSYWFARNASLAIPTEQREDLLPHYQYYLKWCDLMVGKVTRGENNKVPASCNKDTEKEIYHILQRYTHRKDVRFVQVVGENLISVLRSGTSMLEYMNQDGLLRAFYEEGAICSGPTGRWLARIVSQIAHRFPGINILEVGAGTGATTSAVLQELDGKYASYTFTDISSGFFMAAEERFGPEANRMSFKTFNMEKAPSGQGFAEGTYDVAVAVNVLHVSSDLQASLSNIRRLLRPGGFLVVAELTSTELLFSGMTVGTLPGWWIGAETGRPWGPLLSLKQWDATLKQSGFAGIDTVSPNIDDSLPMSVYVAQATDDRVSLLRNPLNIEERPAGIRNEGLAIIGGSTEPVWELGQRVSDVLSHTFHNKRFFKTIEEFAESDMAHTLSPAGPISVLCLTDLDRPFLQDLTLAKFDALKTLWTVSGTVVWTTCDSREGQPYSYMMLGITHTIVTEYPHLSVQLFDIESTADSHNGIQASTANELATTLLRQHALHEWGTNTKELLWTAEPEMFMKNGRPTITRLVKDVQANNRYNSQRSEIKALTDPTKERLQLLSKGSDKEQSLVLRTVSPLHVDPPSTESSRKITITHSLLQALAVGAVGYLRLCFGTDEETGQNVLALTASNEAVAQVPESWCFPLEKQPSPSALVAAGANVLAEQILSLTPAGGCLLINDADTVIRTALTEKAPEKRVKLAFTTSRLGSAEGDSVTFLHPNFPLYVTRSALPVSISTFVHLSRGTTSDAVRATIEKCLPSACFRVNEAALIASEAQASSDLRSNVDLSKTLEQAWIECKDHVPSGQEIIHLADVTRHTAIGEPLAVLDWTSSEEVLAVAQPVDSGLLFQPDRTYLFVGMAGELGQSLGQWMIEHGARYVVLTSRTPKVSPEFVTDMEDRYGAVVKAVSLDITSRDSLESALRAIRSMLPPIAGILNGAMILEDEMFGNMSFDNFKRVTAPKVIGTQLLDEAFHDDTSLDFFVVASSIASIIGWLGQSNYSAANEYMTALVSGRRKRGVTGSAMNIPAVSGVGYAAHASNFDFEYFQSLGYINISEQDLHALFAEAIISGRPDQYGKQSAQVCMGVNTVPADLEVKAAHKRDIKFNHFIVHEELATEVQTAKTGVRVKVQLQGAQNAEQAYSITRDGFLAHLRRMLRFTEEQQMDDSVALVDQGVDSLVAVDIRSWFLKELGVDIPTLKILGGSSIADVVRTTLDKLPEYGDGNQDQSKPNAEAASPPTSTSSPGRQSPTLNTDTTNTSSAGDSLESTPLVRSDDSGLTTPPSRDPLDETKEES